MKLVLYRRYRGSLYCIDDLYVDGKKFCEAIEDRDRGLTQSMSSNEIAKIKVKNETAIPYGNYNITMNVVSPKFY
jgi:hypothetical protein